MLRQLIVRRESWPLRRPFRISRGVKTSAEVIAVEARVGRDVGWGEGVPYARYGETVEGAMRQAEGVCAAFSAGASRTDLQELLPPGAARNAVDCALWDLEVQQSRRPVGELAGERAVSECESAVTISLGSPAEVRAAAAALKAVGLIKLKVAADEPLALVAAVRSAAPACRLIVDPNESWSPEQLESLLPDLASLGVDLLEQPIPAADDVVLESLHSSVCICADEAAHTRADLDRIARRYGAVNVKLDKCGGLTEALAMARNLRERGLILMVGCMISTSLSIQPALLLAGQAHFVDLDGPWWLARDRKPAMHIDGGRLLAPAGGWGMPR